MKRIHLESSDILLPYEMHMGLFGFSDGPVMNQRHMRIVVFKDPDDTVDALDTLMERHPTSNYIRGL